MTQTPQPGGPAADAPPVCPRHADRVSYVRCQRCERPVCPECQRPAAVGVQCVDCVREQARSAPRVRTVLGGPATGGRPVVTISIIIACVVVYVGQLALGDRVTSELVYAPFLTLDQPWRMLTAAFAHSPGTPLHIAFNMYALWLCGSYLEPLLGRVRFAVLYGLSALGGSVGYLALASSSPVRGAAWFTPVLGASGAVFGLFGALLVVNRRLGRDSAGIITLLVINAVLGFVVSGIAWQAHLGGLLTGMATGAVLVARPRTRGTRVAVLQVVGLVGVALVLLAVIAVRVALAPAGLV